MDQNLAERLIEDPMLMLDMSNDALFSMDRETIEAVQLAVIQKRLAAVRPTVRVLDRLATDLEIDTVSALADITPLCLPHTMYKSYSASHLEKGRFDKLTAWLGTVTAHDLSGVDATKCDTIESWMDLLAATTPMRLVCSSGTGGKVSFFPRSTVEQDIRFRGWLNCQRSFGGEDNLDLASGRYDYFSPWPFATGRHNITENFRSIREKIFKEDAPSRFFTLGDGHWDVDLVWLDARTRAAEARGEVPPPVPERLDGKLEAKRARRAGSGQNIDRFIDELMVKREGQSVVMFAPFLQMIAVAQECEKRGLTANWSEDSFILSGGGGSGAKGVEFPDGWLELCKRVFPFTYHETYGMTETTASARKCPQGHYHMPHWMTLFLLDPETSEPLPRVGTNTGRLALFDLLPTTFWGGAITGDRATIHWDGGCSCGRQGAFIEDTVSRYSNLADDDKITCARSPGAYDRVMDFALGAMELAE